MGYRSLQVRKDILKFLPNYDNFIKKWLKGNSITKNFNYLKVAIILLDRKYKRI